MIRKDFKPAYDSEARTLEPEYIGNNDSGWVIEGEIHEDWFIWVNEFKAFHPIHGLVCGDFEHCVYADSQEGLNHFLEHHPYSEWDYHDI